MAAIQASRGQQHEKFVKAMGGAFGGYYAGYVYHSSSPKRDLKLHHGGHADRISDIKMLRDPHNRVPNSLNNGPYSPLAPGA